MRIQTTALTLSLSLALALLASCAATPAGPPDQVASEILIALEAGETDKAGDLFEPVEDESSYREKIYPVVYDAAQMRYEQGEFETSVTMLRFLAQHYPDANAVREALLYGLFLERASQSTPDPQLLDEIEGTLAELQDASSSLPVWVDLVATQSHIDHGRLAEAEEAFIRFRQSWDGMPAALALYVNDLERYLASH